MSAFAQNTPQCPSESFVIEFNSPITNSKKSFCGYLKNGETVKHGEELIFDSKGEIKTRLTYNHGQVGEAPATTAPAFRGTNIPGTEEATAKFTDTLIGTKNQSDEQVVLAAVQDLLAILTLKKANRATGTFKIGKCDNRPGDWVKGALFNSTIEKSYSFVEQCDVKGDFLANFKDEFPMSFDLRNLQDFSKTAMTVKMSVNKSAQGIRYRFEVIEGLITSPSRNANFKVEYEVNVNPMTGVAVASSQKGKITLTKINNKEVNASASLAFDE